MAQANGVAHTHTHKCPSWVYVSACLGLSLILLKDLSWVSNDILNYKRRRNKQQLITILTRTYAHTHPIHVHSLFEIQLRLSGLRGRQFQSDLPHVTGLWARSPLPLPLSLPLLLLLPRPIKKQPNKFSLRQEAWGGGLLSGASGMALARISIYMMR